MSHCQLPSDAPAIMATVGDTYTHGHLALLLRSHAWRTAESSAAYLLASLRPGMDLLNVGCGPGTVTVDLARRVAPGRVIGVDTAAGVIGEQAVAYGFSDREELAAIAGAWRRWAGAPEGFFALLHCEVLAAR